MRRVALPAAAVALLLVVLLLVASALVRPAPPPLAAGQARVEQVDTAAYPQITLYVSAVDDAGNPRTGLDSDDFAVTEDGVPVEIADFGGLGGEALTSVLVVDRSGSMEEDDKIDGAREAAAAFVDLMRPQDRAALISFNEDVSRDQGFTGNRDTLLAAVDDLEADGGTALYDAIVSGVELLREQPGRRLLLVLSDGQDMRDSPVPVDWWAGSERSLDEALEYAAAAGQPVAVVGLGNRAASGDAGIDEAVLQRIADETGGRYFYAPEAGELAALYAGLAAGVQQEYRLTYVSPRPSYDGTRRDIAVSVGGVAAAGAYTERHLINVVSNPVTGVVLLLPLAGLLVLPRVLRRRSLRRGPAPVAGPLQPEAAVPVAPVLATPVATTAPPQAPAFATPIATTAVPPAPAPGAPATLVAGTRRCVQCDAPLRATSRFCSRCGAAQGE